MTESAIPTIEEFRRDARAWLAEHVPLRAPVVEAGWGQGSDSVAVFHNLTTDEEAELIAAGQKWQATKFDAGYGALSWPVEVGGRGLPPLYAAAFAGEEARFDTPAMTELFGVTIGLIAPTIAVHGSAEQQDRFVRPLLRTDMLACQLFSEPGAGSDLAGLSTRAVRDGDEWVITGQKVWTSGAHLAHYGECICRTDPGAPVHQGMTAFLVPLDAPGVEVRPIRQITGGTAFNEVFLDGVRVPDSMRLGAEGDGWKVALTTLANERGIGGSAAGPAPGSFQRVLGLARHLGLTDDPLVRQDLAALYTQAKVASCNNRRVQAKLRAGQTPGPEGSIGKLAWTNGMARTATVVSRLLGPRLAADTEEWGTYAWTEFLLGAPGYRIAGGSDEIQRNIIGERVLGLPKEPRADR
jgi:alkylation response protein AidB-like acyl-CoA dehydrogenase